MSWQGQGAYLPSHVMAGVEGIPPQPCHGKGRGITPQVMSWWGHSSRHVMAGVEGVLPVMSWQGLRVYLQSCHGRDKGHTPHLPSGQLGCGLVVSGIIPLYFLPNDTLVSPQVSSRSLRTLLIPLHHPLIPQLNLLHTTQPSHATTEPFITQWNPLLTLAELYTISKQNLILYIHVQDTCWSGCLVKYTYVGLCIHVFIKISIYLAMYLPSLLHSQFHGVGQVHTSSQLTITCPQTMPSVLSGTWTSTYECLLLSQFTLC